MTTIRPTGVPATGLGAGVINREAIVGILGQNAASYGAAMAGLAAGEAAAGALDPEDIGYLALDPGYIADAVVAAIDQPWGVTLSDIEFWTLEDVDKFNALMDMDEDHNAAYRAYLTPEPKE